MKVVFLSKFYPRAFRDEYLKNSKAGLASAADAHQYALALGFNKVCKDYSIVNIPALYPFPFRYRKLFIRGGFIQENGLEITNVGFCNILFLNRYFCYRKGKAELETIIRETRDLVYIVVYATALWSLRAATELKQRYSNVRISIIVPDLPEDMASKFPTIDKCINTILGFREFDEYIGRFDSYVLLTKYMRERIPCKPGSYIISEGVYDESFTPRTIQQKKNPDRFTILYSGMMHKRFGVMNLVRAVNQIKDQRVCLQLCGYGDAVNEITEFCNNDDRIQYLGVLSRDDVLKKQCDASLLVNPRIPDNNPFTRYSFPSKTLEYLSSGVPTLLYKLDGIPEEYYDYCYALGPEQTSVDSLADAILQIINTPPPVNEELGCKARAFVLREKGAVKAATNIVDLLSRTI